MPTRGNEYSPKTAMVAVLVNLQKGAYIVEDVLDTVSSRARNSPLEGGKQHSASRFLYRILDTIDHPLLVLDEEAHICACNCAYSAMLGATQASILKKSIYDIHEHIWNIPRLRALLQAATKEDIPYSIAEISDQYAELGAKIFVFYARKLIRNGRLMVLLSIEDVGPREERGDVHT
ncbi:hypothetical protein CCAX7_36010 [Capsulimonas corticalis]|uniref:PAS domain-containing protein n=1 Tax=Capsulimonas corticalis TaxID=2219043 RepID=A0A9N7QBQ6_9BACT|nr:PAS domain S-box protein [Capsulimonas corticalis]BDI31550.1 hypothetical protein CCAX7_36010 [Capsulimonas corticalis]